MASVPFYFLGVFVKLVLFLKSLKEFAIETIWVWSWQWISSADMRLIRNDPYLTRTRYNVVQGQNMYIHKGQRVEFVLLEPIRVKIFNRQIPSTWEEK